MQSSKPDNQPRPRKTTLSLLTYGFVALLVGGCFGPGTSNDTANASEPEMVPPLTAADGRDLRSELTKDDQLPAPSWQIGERFRNHVFFGSQDTEGTHFDAIVADQTPDSWILATNDPNIAKEDAIVDIPILGDLKKSDLTMSGFGSPWDLYEFPLYDGATWQTEFPNLNWDSVPEETVTLDIVASFAPNITTPMGSRPGFQMTATAGEHIVAAYDYVPAIGWFAHMTLFDIDEGQDPIEFHVTSMGHDYNWTGTYYIDEAKFLVQHFSAVGVDPDEPTEPILQPAPTATFTMSSGGTYLLGLVASFAVAGAEELTIISPSGEAHHWETVGAPVGEFQAIWEVPAEAGAWRIVSVGAGAATAAFAELYEITETTGVL